MIINPVDLTMFQKIVITAISAVPAMIFLWMAWEDFMR